ncbi:hypothetical protein MCOR27_003529 [Pyricularia oryzae]|uniref:Uncharacterized protein n=1 Tax=Pyricularia oryzae TaxID=318829 RepID=A0A4P7NIW1_PYROR|nr:hypothetical protein MCOR01_006821 [Pyricularia oryzae]KAI6265683.1 hypothetical protein MCOR26_010611 [Pyricularia oryzae]KAI6282937.1 hypothetical protein MCOR27_003529 [Pyricularia oryzae]KAI6289740.1 hypothetical protein MCOR34_010661 [Pyricularia oryzae]KAI6332902.1 hypothetical protein MCOR28_010722 [Pyricularia oryzae]
MKSSFILTFAAAAAVVSAAQSKVIESSLWSPDLPELTPEMEEACENMRCHGIKLQDASAPGPFGEFVYSGYLYGLEQQGRIIKPVPGAIIDPEKLAAEGDKPACHVLVLLADKGELVAYGKAPIGEDVKALFSLGPDPSRDIWQFTTSANTWHPSYCNVHLKDPTKRLPYGLLVVGRVAGEYQLMLNNGLFVTAIGYNTQLRE